MPLLSVRRRDGGHLRRARRDTRRIGASLAHKPDSPALFGPAADHPNRQSPTVRRSPTDPNMGII
ncbi:uncharacterized protein LAESUDRAFT_724522 [Laetiporus sulphureus 93-53]|uniref:Uncharacterized protein n=1 Tax=Laetiporus sulphureus 93-53 TaxID=1314785 RepID=A0A165EZH4_9APHY|nr:uncharacterized protein LAESUDRAFT_724522 [Laetiporus sulphureus 93-53]KZT08045.1 hypothetical protein LAESUDRAFT_724522 [Laetiporus sulphureus 93-53]